MWHTVLITATEWNNFFELRCPEYHVLDKENLAKHGHARYSVYKSRKAAMKDFPYTKDYTLLDWLKINKSGAEIHMSLLAEAIYDAMMESKPKWLEPGEWHIPFGEGLAEAAKKHFGTEDLYEEELEGTDNDVYSTNWKVKIATARCARTSYDNFDGTGQDFDKDVALHDTLLKAKHMSPFEHCAVAMSAEDHDNYILIENGKGFPGVCRNFTGFIQYRAMIEAHL
jgi:thymidylate synthase ThyX